MGPATEAAIVDLRAQGHPVGRANESCEGETMKITWAEVANHRPSMKDKENPWIAIDRMMSRGGVGTHGAWSFNLMRKIEDAIVMSADEPRPSRSG
jgi:hypothetical protein